MRFNRIDICAAHLALEWDYNDGGLLQERPSNIRRRMSTGFQLSRMGFDYRRHLGDDGAPLTANGRAIYAALETRYGFAHERTT